MSLLELIDLKTTYRTEEGNVKAVDGVSLRLERGMNYGLVGESGCGKSTLGKSIIRCLPPNAFIEEGQVFFKGKDLTSLDEDAIRRIRWKEISMITQSAMNALDPVYSVGSQIMEAIRTHERIGYLEAKEKVEEMFTLVGIEKGRLSEYPHQFSGGMRQRSIIAMALILEPSLVVADEPTTALDVIVQGQIFENIKELQKIINFSMLLVTHDIAVVIESCAEIGVMYGGKILETGDLREVINNPFHPYTMGLKNSFPNIKNRHTDQISIPGFPPNLIEDSVGCRFYSRCPFSLEHCSIEEPKMSGVGRNHYAACHNVKNVDEMRERARQSETWRKRAPFS